jgi:hypothetical protein
MHIVNSLLANGVALDEWSGTSRVRKADEGIKRSQTVRRQARK